MSRVFERRRVWRLDEPACSRAASLLADAVARSFGSFDAVVGIARGGCRPGESVAAALGVPAVVVRARHNATDALFSPGSGHVEVAAPVLSGLAEHPHLLIVDDICGSGATLETVRGALRRCVAPRSLRAAVLCRNVGAAPAPDLWVWDVRDWVVFPWETPPEVPTEPLPAPSSVRVGR